MLLLQFALSSACAFFSLFLSYPFCRQYPGYQIFPTLEAAANKVGDAFTDMVVYTGLPSFGTPSLQDVFLAASDHFIRPMAYEELPFLRPIDFRHHPSESRVRRLPHSTSDTTTTTIAATMTAAMTVSTQEPSVLASACPEWWEIETVLPPFRHSIPPLSADLIVYFPPTDPWPAVKFGVISALVSILFTAIHEIEKIVNDMREPSAPLLQKKRSKRQGSRSLSSSVSLNSCAGALVKYHGVYHTPDIRWSVCPSSYELELPSDVAQVVEAYISVPPALPADLVCRPSTTPSLGLFLPHSVCLRITFNSWTTPKPLRSPKLVLPLTWPEPSASHANAISTPTARSCPLVSCTAPRTKKTSERMDSTLELLAVFLEVMMSGLPWWVSWTSFAVTLSQQHMQQVDTLDSLKSMPKPSNYLRFLAFGPSMFLSQDPIAIAVWRANGLFGPSSFLKVSSGTPSGIHLRLFWNWVSGALMATSLSSRILLKPSVLWREHGRTFLISRVHASVIRTARLVGPRLEDGSLTASDDMIIELEDSSSVSSFSGDDPITRPPNTVVLASLSMDTPPPSFEALDFTLSSPLGSPDASSSPLESPIAPTIHRNISWVPMHPPSPPSSTPSSSFPSISTYSTFDAVRILLPPSPTLSVSSVCTASDAGSTSHPSRSTRRRPMVNSGLFQASLDGLGKRSRRS
ncbi:hypothetical protein CERSUDRAFT_98281 [Gelatoporia subvermispora B]|uniref:Uncharacterized protein n=1 Tax=Ceriporiopsis subvermispora (strain B) TaxID=914234 RepID=M2R6D2_CERS8|nr:hypothetical protein CERSUDRAFT_98281 [Gelatoporia subvermispora B]